MNPTPGSPNRLPIALVAALARRGLANYQSQIHN
jgi:hypothetical protein